MGAALRVQLEIAHGETRVGVGPVQEALATLGAEQHTFFWVTFSLALAESLARTGGHAEAIATIDATLPRIDPMGAPRQQATLAIS